MNNETNNEMVKQLFQGIGFMTEIWTMIYNGFISQGLPHDEAIEHTKAFMKAFMSFMIASIGNNGVEDAFGDGGTK